MAEWLHVANDIFDTTQDQTNVIKVASIKSSLNKEGVFELLRDPDTYATVLLALCLINYGNETFKVEPVTLFQWLKEDFGTELHEDNENKLQAILIALTTDYFFTDVNVFQNICKTLESGDPDVFEDNFMNDDATKPEVLWGIYEVALNSEDTVAENMQFSKLVENYINHVLNDSVEDFSDEDDDKNIDSAVVVNNVIAMKEQLIKMGIKDIPKFPAFNI